MCFTPGEHDTFSDEAIAEESKRLPWGRMGLPEDIGRAAAFLVSDDLPIKQRPRGQYAAYSVLNDGSSWETLHSPTRKVWLVPSVMSLRLVWESMYITPDYFIPRDGNAVNDFGN